MKEGKHKKSVFKKILRLFVPELESINEDKKEHNPYSILDDEDEIEVEVAEMGQSGPPIFGPLTENDTIIQELSIPIHNSICRAKESIFRRISNS